MKIRIGYLQFSPIFGEKELNWQVVVKRITRIKRTVAPAIICLPELFATGYSFLNKEELLMMAEEIPGETSEILLELAQRKNLIICAGLAEREKDKVYNSAILCFPDGNYRVYRKAHLFYKEKEIFTPGDSSFSVFEFSNGRISISLGLLICFDYIFPEAARTIALKGAQIILHPSNLILPYGPKITLSRAIENRVFWVLANRTGSEERNGIKLKFLGNSQIIAPNGEILAKSGKREDLVMVEIDPSFANSKKVTPTNDLFSDRRIDLYFK